MSNEGTSIVNFSVTKNMDDAGISEFYLKKQDFIIKFKEGGSRAINFDKTKSVSATYDKFRKKLKGEPWLNDSILNDIQSILIQNGEIFDKGDSVTNGLARTYTSEIEEARKRYCSFEQWQEVVAEKYEVLRVVTERNFPGSWPILQFCIAVKTIMNIDGCTLPFMGVILCIPSSMKTLVIQLFKNYPFSYYSDNFTPAAFQSHNASLTEEKLEQIDLLPKLHNMLFLTPELAPIFTANEDDLRKSLGIVTRVLDGHGLETDSGAQGHRSCEPTFFPWIGAAVEVPYRVWKLLGSLGHKIYFFRPEIKEKTIGQLEDILWENDFQRRFDEVEKALLEYMSIIDSAPASSNSVIDKSGITKVKWKKDYQFKQNEVLTCVAQIANLQKRLRGTVYIARSNTKSKVKQNNPNDISEESTYLYNEEPDYDTDYPVIEDPSRAAISLRNLALAHAFSQGRNYLVLQDVRLIVDVALSTTTRGRYEVMRLLLDHDGEVTTSDITRENKVSPSFAKKTMREMAALGIVEISSLSGYANSELKISLREEYSWFKQTQFQSLFKPCFSNNNTSTSPGNQINTNEDRDLQEKSNYDEPAESRSQSHADSKSTTDRHRKNDNTETRSISDFINSAAIPETIDRTDQQKISIPPQGAESIQHVTFAQSHELGKEDAAMHVIAMKEVIEVIKNENGSLISFDAAKQSACSRNPLVKAYFGDKLTARENKKIRKLAEMLHLYRDNIEVVKTRPQIILRWIGPADNIPSSVK